MRVATFAVAGLLFWQFGAAVPAQQVRDGQPPPRIGRAEINGLVVSADGGPLRGAHVSLAGSAYDQQTVITDESGTFRFVALPSGRLTLTARKPAYLTAAFAAKRPGGPGTSVVIEDGQVLSGITLKMHKGGVITGRITDQSGRPLSDVGVSASRLGWQAGTRQPLSIGSVTGSATTDDQGTYRFFGLVPGEYLIHAVMPPGGSIQRLSAAEIDAALNPQQQAPGAATADSQTFGTSPMYFPGTPVRENAVSVSVAVGEETGGVDFAVGLVRTVRISGAIAGGPVDSATRVTVALTGGALGPNGRSVSINESAGQPRSFQFVGIAPGHYYVTTKATSAASGTTGTAWARAEIDVTDGSVDGLQMLLQPALQISGHVVFERLAASPPYSEWVIGAVSVDLAPTSPSGRSPISADGTFTIPGLAPGRYTLYAQGATPELNASRAWDLKSATLGSIDAVDFPIDLRPGGVITGVVATMTNQRSELSGKLRTLAGQAAPDFFVIVFPVNKALWTGDSRYVRAARPGSDGSFRFTGLPGADYHMAALNDVENGEWTNPAFLEGLVSAAARVTLAAGEKKIQDLQIQK